LVTYLVMTHKTDSHYYCMNSPCLVHPTRLPWCGASNPGTSRLSSLYMFSKLKETCYTLQQWLWTVPSAVTWCCVLSNSSDYRQYHLLCTIQQQWLWTVPSAVTWCCVLSNSSDYGQYHLLWPGAVYYPTAVTMDSTIFCVLSNSSDYGQYYLLCTIQQQWLWTVPSAVYYPTAVTIDSTHPSWEANSC
jgi:hypothetical protein